MADDALIVEMLRAIQGRTLATEGVLTAVRSELQHLSRRIDNVMNSALLQRHSARAEASELLGLLRNLMARPAERPTARRPGKKAAAKRAAPGKAPARTAAAKKATPTKVSKRGGRRG